MLSVDSNGASTSGDNAGTGKSTMKGLLGGLEPSPELLAIAMGEQSKSACSAQPCMGHRACGCSGACRAPHASRMDMLTRRLTVVMLLLRSVLRPGHPGALAAGGVLPLQGRVRP